jgi:hypothetical protein
MHSSLFQRQFTTPSPGLLIAPAADVAFAALLSRHIEESAPLVCRRRERRGLPRLFDIGQGSRLNVFEPDHGK